MKIIKAVLKFGLVAGLITVLMRKGFISLDATKRAFQSWEYLGPAFLILTLNTLLGITRWNLLLHAQGIRTRWLQTARLSFIGNFFNIALPGAVSGDFVKAYYLSRELKTPGSKALGTILFDRVAGVSAMVVVSAMAFLYGANRFGSSLWTGVQLTVILAALGSLAFYAYLFFLHENRDPILKILRRTVRKWPRLGTLERTYRALRDFHAHRAAVAKAFFISVVIHIICSLACYFFLLALTDAHLGLLGVLVVTPLGLLVTAIPIFPAGVGTGHAAFLVLYRLLGTERGADVFSLFALHTLFMGFLGAIVYLIRKSQGHGVEGVPTSVNA